MSSVERIRLVSVFNSSEQMRASVCPNFRTRKFAESGNNEPDFWLIFCFNGSTAIPLQFPGPFLEEFRKLQTLIVVAFLLPLGLPFRASFLFLFWRIFGHSVEDQISHPLPVSKANINLMSADLEN